MLIQNRFPGYQGQLHLVERLCPEAVRPPELRIFDCRLQIADYRIAKHCWYGFFGLYLTARRGYFEDGTKIGFLPALQLYFRAEADVPVCMGLSNVDILKFRLAVTFQADILPNSDRRQLGTPVPAPLAGRLAQVRSAGEVASAHQGQDSLLCPDVRYRGAKDDL